MYTVELRGPELGTLRSLVLGGVIENQNSDFVMALGVKPGWARLARAMHKFFSKIHEIPRTSAARAQCASYVPVNSTVLNLVLII
jgi:hypothetical protein